CGRARLGSSTWRSCGWPPTHCRGRCCARSRNRRTSPISSSATWSWLPRSIAPDSKPRVPARARSTSRSVPPHRSNTICSSIERARRKLSGVGAPPPEIGRSGRTADFAGLEDDPDVFRQCCVDVVAHRAPLLAAVRDLFETVRDARAELIVIEAPMTSSHRRRFYDTPEWEAYRAYVRSETERFGGRFVDASDWMVDAAFEDAVHLSAA